MVIIDFLAKDWNIALHQKFWKQNSCASILTQMRAKDIDHQIVIHELLLNIVDWCLGVSFLKIQ